MAKYRTKLRTVEAVQVTAGMVEGTEPCPVDAEVEPHRRFIVVRTALCRLYHARVGWWLIPAGGDEGDDRILYERPLTDDEFRARYELVEQAPTIVCLCGSSRFGEVCRKANLDETLAGNLVLSAGYTVNDVHLRKIDLADEVLILNVGGYIGEDTSRELAYARERGKRVRFLEEPAVESICGDCGRWEPRGGLQGWCPVYAVHKSSDTSCGGCLGFRAALAPPPPQD